MTDNDYARKLDELDRLLNDPDVSMQPDRIWSLLAELSRADGSMQQTRPATAGAWQAVGD